MNINPRLVRSLGTVLLVLGLGSAWMRTQMNMDTILTNWMGAAQPWSGIAMAAVGVLVLALAARLRARAES